MTSQDLAWFPTPSQSTAEKHYWVKVVVLPVQFGRIAWNLTCSFHTDNFALVFSQVCNCWLHVSRSLNTFQYFVNYWLIKHLLWLQWSWGSYQRLFLVYDSFSQARQAITRVECLYAIQWIYACTSHSNTGRISCECLWNFVWAPLR